MKAEASWLWVNSRHPFGTLTFSIAKLFLFVPPLSDWAKVLVFADVEAIAPFSDQGDLVPTLLVHFQPPPLPWQGRDMGSQLQLSPSLIPSQRQQP
ncbi:hypothetical protein NG791_16185 [Laspinema sp. D1]|uniref:hypothetical protein n=1 Tax=Laspinema palackyanum TaxID=3231601 RepID=UPI003472EDE8|nr:hypothetical protein [Laspinema sp. D2b]